MKKSVKTLKFLPQESNNENTAPAKNKYLMFRFSTKNAITNKKNTTTPMYAGAATIG